MRKPYWIFLGVLILCATLVSAAVIYSNVISKQTEVIETPVNLEFQDIDLTGYPHPLGGMVETDITNWTSPILQDQLIDIGVRMTSALNMTCHMNVNLTGNNTSTVAWIYLNDSWTQLQFVNGLATIPLTIPAGTSTLPLIFAFGDSGTHGVMIWVGE